MIEAKERCLKSPKKVTTCQARCGSSGDSSYINLLISYCGTPLVYYVGVEENRRQARDFIRSRVRVVSDLGKVAPSPHSGVATTPPPAGEVFTLAVVDSNNPAVHNIPGQVEELQPWDLDS